MNWNPKKCNFFALYIISHKWSISWILTYFLLSFNELIDKYNEGMKLSAFCLDELNRAKDAIYAEVDVKDNKIIEKKLDIEGDY